MLRLTAICIILIVRVLLTKIPSYRTKMKKYKFYFCMQMYGKKMYESGNCLVELNCLKHTDKIQGLTIENIAIVRKWTRSYKEKYPILSDLKFAEINKGSSDQPDRRILICHFFDATNLRFIFSNLSCIYLALKSYRAVVERTSRTNFSNKNNEIFDEKLVRLTFYRNCCWKYAEC